MSDMRARVIAALVVVCGVSGCTTGGPSAPPPAAQTGGVQAAALPLGEADPPVPGGEVGSASSEFTSTAELPVWLKLSDTEGDLNRLTRLEIADGHLTLEPKPSAWFDGFRGPFVYQELAGDIVMHMRVKSEGLKGGSPKQIFSLGGAMVRLPDSDAKPNWLSVTTGTGDVANRVEVKETLDGSSKPEEHPVKAGWVELVLARTGSLVAALYKEEGGAWKVGRRWNRPDLAEAQVLQWGMTGYTDWNSFGTLKQDPAKANLTDIKGRPDLKLSVDFVRFLRPHMPDGVDPMNPASVSDEVLIRLLTPAGA